jgi:hypothetical protein
MEDSRHRNRASVGTDEEKNMKTQATRIMARVALVAGAAFVLVIGVQALQANGQQGSAAPAKTAAQRLDGEYTKRILDSTPDKRILTELVDHMPASATVPSP